jgi:hypothetical protein
VKGNPEPMQRMFSHREDVSLANPLGPAARGWESRLVRLWSVPHRISEMARSSLALRT